MDREKRLEYDRRYHTKHREEIRQREKQYKTEHKEYIRKCKKVYRQKNIEKLRAYDKEYQSNPKYRDHYNLWQRKRRKTDLKFKVSEKMRCSINKSIKKNKNGRCWEDLVGYKLTDLIKRLKFTLPKGYTWQDYLDGRLQMDHIIPILAFNYTKPSDPDFQRCWALDNLQLLSTEKNREKGIKLLKPFQPALKF